MKELIKPEKFPFYYGWVIIFAGTVGLIMSIPGQTMGISLFTEDFIKHLNFDRTALSQSYMIGTLCSATVLTYFGGLYDKWGARPIIITVSFFMGLALFYLAQLVSIQKVGSQLMNIQTFTFVMFCLGFFVVRLTGQGLMTTVSRAMMAKWFDKKRGFVLSLSTIITSFGFSASPTIIKPIISNYGWQNTLIGMAIMICPGMLIFGYLFFKDNPEAYGLKMDGISSDKINQENKLRDEKNYTLSEAMKTLTFWTYSITFTLPSLYVTAYTFHHVAIGQEFGFTSEEMGYLFFPIAIISTLASFVSGILSDKISLHTILKFQLMMIILSFISLPYFDHTIGKIILLLSIGFSQGVFLTLVAVTWPKLFGRKYLGKISSFSMACIVFGSAFGPYIFALSFQYTGSFNLGAISLLPVPLILLVMSLFLPKHQ